MNEIEWAHGKKIDVSQIEAAEAALGTALPSDFKSLAQDNDGAVAYAGGVPFKDPYSGRDDVVGIGQLLNFEPEEGRIGFLPANQALAVEHPGLVAFAIEGAGWYLCFDYRKAEAEPPIVLLVEDSEVVPLAESFAKLLEMAGPDEERDDIPSEL